jgi:stalled ribosome alternative rescue factor ArfA
VPTDSHRTLKRGNILTSLVQQLLPRQESRLCLPRVERATGVEDQSNLGQGYKTTWEFGSCKSEIQTQLATKDFWGEREGDAVSELDLKIQHRKGSGSAERSGKEMWPFPICERTKQSV